MPAVPPLSGKGSCACGTLTCRFPSCDRARQVIRSRGPRPACGRPGRRSPRDLRLLCRRASPRTRGVLGRWARLDPTERSPDGSSSVGVADREGSTSRVPGSELWFPGWNTVTHLGATRRPVRSRDRDALCGSGPRRCRAAANAPRCDGLRIRRERALNDAHVAEQRRRPHAVLAWAIPGLPVSSSGPLRRSDAAPWCTDGPEGA